GRALGALQHVAGEGAVDRHGTGATACYRNGVNVLLGPTAQVRLGETADLAAVADQCGTVRTNPVDRHRTTNGCRATALDRAGQRGDGQAVAATDVQPQCLVRTGGHQPAVVDQHLIFTVDHVDHDGAAHAGGITPRSVDADTPDLAVQGRVQRRRTGQGDITVSQAGAALRVDQVDRDGATHARRATGSRQVEGDGPDACAQGGLAGVDRQLTGAQDYVFHPCVGGISDPVEGGCPAHGGAAAGTLPGQRGGHDAALQAGIHGGIPGQNGATVAHTGRHILFHVGETDSAAH